MGTEHWRGKDREKLRLPDLPRLRDGRCPECGSTEALVPDRIYYRNYHGPFNTGLPDYFVLEIVETADSQRYACHRKWGNPYIDAGIGRIPWPEMVQRIEEFAEEDRRARAWAEINKDWVVGPAGGDPSFWNYEPKARPDEHVVAEQLSLLRAHWSEIVGPEVAAITCPLRFSGRKKRCLVVWADESAQPPWGSWLSLSNYRPKRRAFTEFRAAINKAISPMEIDHVEFTTTALLAVQGRSAPDVNGGDDAIGSE
jgi:hypothetical protein